jgi:ketosteroid isomerase-like protein
MTLSRCGELTALVVLCGMVSVATPVASMSPGDDAATVTALDTEYQAAVKHNDATTMDRILADDFVLVTGRGQTYSAPTRTLEWFEIAMDDQIGVGIAVRPAMSI